MGHFMLAILPSLNIPEVDGYLHRRCARRAIVIFLGKPNDIFM